MISIHALRVEGDIAVLVLIVTKGISIHALRVEGDGFPAKLVHPLRYFYPRPPGGGRRDKKRRKGGARYFYPRPPGGGRRLKSAPYCFGRCIFLSTPSGWRATLSVTHRAFACTISIHALRVEGDCSCIRGITAVGNFYPRPPGGGRQSSPRRFTLSFPFLSTPSGWRATTTPFPRRRGRTDFYPRPPGGGRPKI